MSSITVFPSYPTREGGFEIRRAFPSQTLGYVGPFLMLDYFGPMQLTKGEKPGVSDHPHRGFQTVTYIVEGEIEHNDTRGNHGIISPGGIQWMKAGSGIVHREFPSDNLVEQGGVLKGLQLWVNLPAKDKMSDPLYQDYTAKDLPVVQKDNYQIRVICGEWEGTKSPVKNGTPLLIGHVTIEKGVFEWEIEEGFSSALLVLDGQVEVSDGKADKTALESDLVVITESTKVTITCNKKANIFIMSGEPIKEPIARYGPFVMNTADEIKQALLDYQSGVLN
jgi:quercetin 2,3-dioxygenase